MHKMIEKCLFTLFFLSQSFTILHASSFEEKKKAKMIQDLEIIKHHFEIGYAPAEWKKEFAGWDINEAFENSKNQILLTPKINTKQFHQVIKGFLKTMKDYHVRASFYSTESAALPFSIRGIDGRYFIDWIDPIRLPFDYFGIRKGDELIHFNGQPIAEVVDDLLNEISASSNEKTDQRLAELKLTLRTGETGDIVPQGPILITTYSSKKKKKLTQQLHWAYTPEHIINPLDFIPSLESVFGFSGKPKIEEPEFKLPKILMSNPLHQVYGEKYKHRDGGLGAKNSFLPALGKIIWSIENMSDGNFQKPFWQAYIYQHPQGYNIGFIRIPHYHLPFDSIEDLGKILQMMDGQTDALVIDQLHNSGGFVDIQYSIASILAIQPLQTPLHRIKITQKEVLEAYLMLENIRTIEQMLENKSNEEEPEVSPAHEENQQENNQRSGFNPQEILFLKTYFELVIDEWSKGHHLTRPTPILGVDKINPHQRYHYQKPILMLIDEMDFSAGDFFPAILQDNKRALLFGSRTAGAGGYVFSFQFPNNHGIASCHYTASIAERTDLKKIENLGVTPDIPYQLTIKDLTGEYRGYINAVNKALESLLENSNNFVIRE